MWLNNHLILKFRMTILENQAEYKILQVLGVISRETLLFHWKSKLTHKIRRNKLLRKTCSCGRTIRSRKQRLLFSSCVMDSTPFTIKEIKLPFAFKPDPDRHEISLSLSPNLPFSAVAVFWSRSMKPEKKAGWYTEIKTTWSKAPVLFPEPLWLHVPQTELELPIRQFHQPYYTAE